jgi:GT2 family glycosyltransferase
MFLDADDVLEPDALETLTAALNADSSAVGAHGTVRFIDDEGRRIRPGEGEAWTRERWALVNGKIVQWPLHLPTTLSVLVLLNRIRTPGSVLLRREIVESVGGFDPGLAIAEDYLLWLKLALHGHFAFVDRLVLAYRLHKRNASGDIRRTDAARWRMQRALARATWLTSEQRELMVQGVRYARLLGSLDWFSWAKKSIQSGQPGMAANQARHALIELLRFYFGSAVA